MGRGTAQEVEALKCKIVSEATRLFAAQGFEATSVSDVAKAVDVSKALVLYHFGSKGELRDRVMEKVAEAWSQLFPKVIAAKERGEEPVRALFVAGIEVFRMHPDLGRLLMREILSEDRSTGQVLKAEATPVLQSLEALLRHSIDTEIPEDVDVQAIFVFFGLALLGVVAVFPLEGDRLSEDDAELGVRVLRQMLRSLEITLDAEFGA